MKFPRSLLLATLLVAAGSHPAFAQGCGVRPCIQPPSADFRAPAVSALPHNGVFATAVMGSATAAYGTPAYVSADQSRSLALMYASGMASPTTLIQVDATDIGSSELPSQMSIRVRSTQTGAWQTFTNGSTQSYYEAGTGTRRLSAHLSTAGLASGAYNYDVVVRSHWPDGSFRDAAAVTVRVLVVNEANSPYGAGWIISGVQRLVPTANGIYLFEGDGTARWFAYPGTCVQGTAPEYCAYTSPDGDFTRLARNTQTGAYWRHSMDGTLVEFGADGRMVAIHGEGITRFAYLADGRLSTVTDGTGRVTQLGYDAAGKLAWIQEPAGRTVTTRVQPAGVLDQICDPAGCGFAAGYDASRRMSWTTDAAGARTDFEYDAFGALRRVLDPTVAVDGQGSVRPATTFGSLAAALLPATGTGTATAPAAAVLPASVRISATDARSSTATFAVDRFGNPTSITEPLGRTTTVQRDQHGRPTRVTAFNGDVTEYTYTGGFPATVRDVTNNRTTTFTWTQYWGAPNSIYPIHAYGDFPVVVSTPGEAPVRYEKPGLEPLPVDLGATKYAYEGFDEFGRPSELYGPGGHTRFFYAASGGRNLDSMSVYAGRDTLTSRFTRDGAGRVTQTVSATGAVSGTTYDAVNRVLTATGPEGTTTYTYAPGRWLQTVTDPRSQVYTYGRNALGWLEWEQDPRGGVMRTTYDALGRTVSSTNRSSQAVRWEYDALGQMTRQTTHEGAVTTYAYDPAGRWMAVQNGESTDTLRTIRGTAPSVDQVAVHAGVRYVLNTRRDTVSNFSRVTTSWGYGVTHHYLGDHSGRLRELRDDRLGLSTVITRNETANTTAYVLPSGDSIIHGARETRYTDPSASAALARYYGYAATGHLYARGPSWSLNDSYSYDPRLQLSVEQQYDYAAGGYVSRRDYTYDASGNPTHSGASVSTGNRLDAFDGYTVTYDADGNQIRKYKPQAGIDWYYWWNSLGQLVEVHGTLNAGNTWHTITFGYDGMGRRVRKTDRGVTTRYLYDGHHLVAETDAAGNVTREFTWYEGVDRPHSMRVGGQTYYYVADHQGNVTGLVNAYGTLVNRYEYTPFGAPLVVSEGISNPLRFAGGYMDVETGLYNNRARFYDPALQRFLSEDPIGLAGGTNLYAYAGNDPLNHSDPTGLDPCGSIVQTLVNGECKENKDNPVVLPPAGPEWSEPTVVQRVADWFWRRREFIIDPADETAYMASLDDEAQRRQWEESRRERIEAAVRSAREAADLGVGFIPGAATVHDITVASTGYNAVTGTQVGWGGRGVAFVGAVTPVSGPQIRAGYTVIQGGMKVSLHAAYNMGARHISGNMVSAALRKGTRYFDSKYGTIAHVLKDGFASGRSLTVWWDPAKDMVSSVLRSSKKNPIRPWYTELP